jgi:tetraacyldisaccharide 4'-kinase
MRLLQYFLLPFSLLYGLVMLVRNLFYNARILPSVSFPLPVISVGNLSMGGTGKTPVVEYLIRLLKDPFHVATLSRGYGRETRGYLLASRRTNSRYIGDEPLQYVKKFRDIRVAVDEKRARGIRKLLEKAPDTDVVLLDDAFQHRHVIPGLSILVMDYNNPYFEDHVFPSGRLREFSCGAKRADLILVTKTPKIFSPITRRRMLEDLRPASHQKVFFSYIKYGAPLPVFEPQPCPFPAKLSYLLLFTGIASDYPLREHLERCCSDLTVIRYPDHHPYSEKDALYLKKCFDDLPSRKKAMVTTEKDMMRLKNPEIGNILRSLPLYYIPIEFDFHGSEKDAFDKAIVSYVEKNKRDRRVPGNENNHPA